MSKLPDKSFITDMLSDIGGSVSHKRVITFLAFLSLELAFMVNIFFEVKIEEFIFDGMMYVVAAGMGFSVAEYFSKRNKGNGKTEPLNIQSSEVLTISNAKVTEAVNTSKVPKEKEPEKKKSNVTEIINEGITHIEGILNGD